MRKELVCNLNARIKTRINTFPNSIVKRLTQERFVKDSKPTIGVEFGEKIVEMQGKMIRCQIWYVVVIVLIMH